MLVFPCLMTNQDFSSWLQDKLTNKGWSQADLSRETGLSTGGVAQLMNGRRNPGPEACTAIAKAFGLPPDAVFRAAGLLPSKSELDAQTERMIHLLSQMTEDEQETWFKMGEVFVNRHASKPRTRPTEV